MGHASLGICDADGLLLWQGAYKAFLPPNAVITRCDTHWHIASTDVSTSTPMLAQNLLQ